MTASFRYLRPSEGAFGLTLDASSAEVVPATSPPLPTTIDVQSGATERVDVTVTGIAEP